MEMGGTGDARESIVPSSVSIYAMREGTKHLLRPRVDELAALVADPKVNLWVDIEGSTEAHMAMLRDLMQIHPLLIEDAFKAQDTPKIEVHDEYAYFIVLGPEEPDPVPGEVTLRDLDVFIAERFVVTHHEGNVSAVPHVRQMVERFPDLLAQGPAVVAHRIVDFMVDRFMVRMNTLGERVDGLELAALRATTPAVLETILEAKHDVLHLGRLVRHQKEVLRALATGSVRFVPSDVRPFFRDIYDHFVSIADQSEAFRDAVSDALDAYLSMQSHRLNDVMKALTMISTIMLPLMFITGLYGMNFDYMPGLHHAYGYHVAVTVMATTASGIFVYFKRRNWW
ncbi:MAG: magnesium/cobalt transporter CorA [Sandaracinaceae bacterium]|nr:magnesium/cobalt transporter CorA [Sandaracinaceae bacterium]MBK8407407.1 magnesium/cobalt transporter CorA [Sandaracinaceae bacterium]